MAPLSNIYRRIFLNSIFRSNGRIYRFISTSEKKAETKEVCEPPKAIYKKDFTKPLEKNWMSYGVDTNDKTEDRFQIHYFYFCLFTWLLCGAVFFYIYAPDKNLSDWARREAFIRLHEREQLGLEPVDPNYIDPSKIVLPPDEELSDDDIVI